MLPARTTERMASSTGPSALVVCSYMMVAVASQHGRDTRIWRRPVRGAGCRPPGGPAAWRRPIASRRQGSFEDLDLRVVLTAESAEPRCSPRENRETFSMRG